MKIPKAAARNLFRFAPLLYFFIALGFHALALGVEDSYDKALALYQHKQYDQALVLARQALRENSNNPAHLHLYGCILVAIGQPGNAEEYLRGAFKAAPDQAQYAYDLGALLHNERKYAEAVPVLQQSVALAPGNLIARMMLARSYVFSYHELKLANFVELTLTQLNYIVRKNPRFPAVHHHLALVYINSGDFAKAEAELNAELRLFPGNAQARLELGETLLKLNQNKKAIDQLLIAAKQAPQMPPIFFALGKAYRADGQAENALKATRQCVTIDPRFPTCHYLLGQIYAGMQQPGQAKEQFELFKQFKSPGSGDSPADGIRPSTPQ